MAVYKPKGAKHFKMDFTHRGVRVAKTTGKATRREALLAEAEERQRIDEDLEGTPRSRQATKHLSEAIERAFDEVLSERKDGRVVLSRLKAVMQIGGDVPLRLVNADYLHRVKLHLEHKGRSPQTVNHYLGHIRHVLTLAHGWDWLERVPKFHMKKVAAKGRFFVYSKEDEDRILGWFLNEWHRRPHVNEAYSGFGEDMADLFAFLLDTGMRLGEAVQLTDNGYSINMDEGILRLDPADMDLKSGKQRVIPMTSRVQRILEERLALKRPHPGKPFDYGGSRCAAAMRMMQKALGFGSEACLHACRHTCLTRLLRGGVDIETVRCWAGHCSIVVTQRYLQTDETMLKAAVKALEYGPDGRKIRAPRHTLRVVRKEEEG